MKNGKIKKAYGNEGMLLMQKEECLAAINYLSDPHEVYISRKLSRGQQLVIIAYLQVREMITEPPSERFFY